MNDTINLAKLRERIGGALFDAHLEAVMLQEQIDALSKQVEMLTKETPCEPSTSG
ncbi:MAG: hypothetical protein P4L93_11705 [Coriobacteriia bacterium]|nr:hypothetical protein [Coriobacteriia bacterium]